MPEINERQELPSNSIGNRLQPPPHLNEPSDQIPPNQAARPKATGPRTAQGKKRSRCNALKHGLLSRFVLVMGESKDDYRSLLNELQDDLRPQGKLEFVVVEHLAALLWRLGRFTKAESAEIAERISFVGTDIKMNQADEALQLSRGAIASDGLMAHHDNPFVAGEIIDIWTELRNIVSSGKFNEIALFFINKLYGVNQYGETPDPSRQAFVAYAEALKLPNVQAEHPILTSMKENLILMIDGEIERFSTLKKIRESFYLEKVLFRRIAAAVPSGVVSDRLMHYEAHLSREIDKALNRLERLQRIRKGQPLPPQVDVKIS
jgi:hypothetical protein